MRRQGPCAVFLALTVFCLLGCLDGKAPKKDPAGPAVIAEADRAAGAAAPDDVEPVPPVDIPGMDPILRKRFDDRSAATLVGSREERAEAYGKLGQLAHGFSLLSVAEAAYQNAVTLSPEEFRWVYLLARVLEERLEPEAAARTYQRAINLSPDDPLPALRLAYLQLEQGHFSLATQAFEQVLEIEPGNPAGQVGLELSQAYQQTGDSAAGDSAGAARHGAQSGEGGNAFRDPWMEAVNQERTGVAWWLQRGSQALGQGRFDDAISAFRRVITSDPENKAAHHHLASALARSGDQAAAFAAFEKAILLSPNDPLMRFDYGSQLAAAEKFPEARKQLQQAVTLGPDFKEAHQNLGSVMARMGLLEEAEVQFSRVLELDPKYDRALLARSAALRDLGRKEEAIQVLQLMVKSQPDHTQARSSLAQLLHETGNLDAAIVQYREIVSRQPSALAWVNLGSLLSWSNRIPEAASAYQKALAIDPKFLQAQLKLAALFAKEERHSEALEAWRRALTLDAELPEAKAGELLAMIELGQCSETLKRLETFSQQPGSQYPALSARWREVCES